MIYVVLTIVILFIIIGIVLLKIRNRAINRAIFDKRKTEDDAIKVLKERYNLDYNEFKDDDYEELTITSKDGFKLKGYLYNKNPISKKVILITHGYTVNHIICTQFMKMFFELGFNVLLIDVRAHGKSEGKYTTYGIKEREDMSLWINKIKEIYGDNILLGLHGQSMGGATVLMCSKIRNDINFIISDCPYSNGRDILRYKFKQSNVPFFPIYQLVNFKIKSKYGFDMDDVSPIDDIKESKVPVLFIHGTSDTTTPPWMSKEMYKTKSGANDKLLLVKDGKHVGAFAKDREGYTKIVKEFIKKVIESKEE